MTKYLDPFDYIPGQNINEKLEMALDNPYDINFRSNDTDKVSFEPEDQLIRNVIVDRANNNVEVQYNPQSVEEKYVVLMKGAGIGIVESHANIPTGEYSSTTTVNYHVVTPELNLVYDGNGYKETANDLPRQAAMKAPELIERAEQLGEADFRPASELEPSENRENQNSTVPPPRKDSMFED